MPLVQQEEARNQFYKEVLFSTLHVSALADSKTQYSN